MFTRRWVVAVLGRFFEMGRKSMKIVESTLKKTGRSYARSAKMFGRRFENRAIYYIFRKKITATLILVRPRILRSTL